MHLLKPLFKSSGKNVVFNPYDYFTYSNISLGNDVYIGPGANFSSITSIKIGNKVMFGPNVTIMGGDHNTSEVGKYMFDVDNKLPENDLPVEIENDVWIASNVIILKGVTIGKGSIIGAGALVTRNIPEYSIAVGRPAKVVKKRFDEEMLSNHIRIVSDLV